MELKQLGNAEVMVPEIGLGIWHYRGGVELLRRGIELGMLRPTYGSFQISVWRSGRKGRVQRASGANCLASGALPCPYNTGVALVAGNAVG